MLRETKHDLIGVINLSSLKEHSEHKKKKN